MAPKDGGSPAGVSPESSRSPEGSASPASDGRPSGEGVPLGSVRPGRAGPSQSGAAAAATRVAKPQGPAAGGTLVLAAQRAAVSPTAGTVHDVLADRAFGHYAEGLRQYLLIRVGEQERARKLFSRLRDQVAELAAREATRLVEPPGVRARVYRMARELSESATAAPRSRPGTLPWYAAPAATPHHAAGLTRVREELDTDARELLELRYARDLGPAEIAFVRGESREDVEQALQRAEDEARARVASGDRSQLPRALLEAFALDRLEAAFASSSPHTASPHTAKTAAADGAPPAGAEPPAARPGELPPLPVGTVVDLRYRLDAHIGSGGFADVYRASDVAVPGHRVALKLLKRPAATEAAREAALRELRMTAAVFHPSVVQFKDHGWIQDRFWFVMPWYEGESLEQRIERDPLSRAEARRVFEPLAQALATMHAAGIRHQDVKPDNIFLAKIRGFGLDTTDDAVLPVMLDLGVAASDADRVLAGTPTYFAPEVAAQFAYVEGDPLPQHEVGTPADIFSLALSLRNALEPKTQPQVVGGNVDAFIRERAIEIPPAPRGKDLRYLQDDFARWMAPDPAARPTAEEFANELRRLTAPEERRARRFALLRVVVPLAIAIIAVFGTIAYEFSLQAAEEERKVADLSSRLETIEDETEEAERLRLELEAAVSAAEAEIAQGSLSRQELERALADALGAQRAAEGALARQRKARRDAEADLAARQASLSTARAEVSRLESALAQEEATSATRASALSTARERADGLAAELRSAQASLSTAQGELASAQASATRAQAALSSAQQETQDARRVTLQTQQSLRESEARVTELERQLAAARRSGASSSAATGGGSGGSTGSGSATPAASETMVSVRRR